MTIVMLTNCAENGRVRIVPFGKDRMMGLDVQEYN